MKLDMTYWQVMRHSLAYVIPSSPHTGKYMLLHIHTGSTGAANSAFRHSPSYALPTDLQKVDQH